MYDQLHCVYRYDNDITCSLYSFGRISCRAPIGFVAYGALNKFTSVQQHRLRNMIMIIIFWRYIALNTSRSSDSGLFIFSTLWETLEPGTMLVVTDAHNAEQTTKTCASSQITLYIDTMPCLKTYV